MTVTSTDRAGPRAKRFTLTNGMRVIVQPEEATPLVAMHVCYAAGSRGEPSQSCGLAHVCEHIAGLAPQGASAQTYSEVIESCGGLANGSTSHERISFSAVLPSHQLTLGLCVEASRMSRPLDGLTAASFDAQRSVVIQEYRQRVGNRPYGRSFELVQRLLYPPGHPYHWPPGGLPECVANISREEAETFFRTNFTPDKATLILVGNVSPGAAAEVESLFDAIPAGVGDINSDLHVGLESRPRGVGRREVVEDRVPFPRVYMAFSAPGFGEAGWYAASLWLRCLAVGRTSPLQQKLIHERGVAQALGAQMVTMRDASTAAFVATAAPDIGRQQLEESLRAALEEVLAEGVSEARLGRARTKALTDHFSSIQRIEHRAEFVATSAVFSDDPAHAVNEHYRRLSPADISEFGLGFCRAEDCAMLSIVPQGSVS